MGDDRHEDEIPAAELVERISSGDRSAENALVHQYQRRIRFFLLRYTRGDLQLAEDLCQETLITVIERLRREPLDAPDRLPAFIHGVAKRLFGGDLRNTIRRRTEADSDIVDKTMAAGDDAIETLSRSECQELVRQLIFEMNVPRDREVLLRAYVMDQDKVSICAAMDLDQRHYDRVIYRAKQRFRELAEQSSKRAHLKVV